MRQSWLSFMMLSYVDKDNFLLIKQKKYCCIHIQVLLRKFQSKQDCWLQKLYWLFSFNYRFFKFHALHMKTVLIIYLLLINECFHTHPLTWIPVMPLLLSQNVTRIWITLLVMNTDQCQVWIHDTFATEDDSESKYLPANAVLVHAL